MASHCDSDLSKLALSNEKFTKSFFKIIRVTPGNLFFSPISIEAVLALAFAGAKGKTAEQIQAAVYLPKSVQEAAKSFGTVMSIFEQANSVTLKFAYGLYTDKALIVNSDYLSLVQNEFRANVEKVDFSKSQEATKQINQWVADMTNQKITELFRPGVLSSATKLVLLNVVYFKGNWDKKFPAENTKKGLFHLNKRETINVDYMSVESYFSTNYNKKLDADIVELPYEGETVKMMLLVPRQIEGLSRIENKFKEVTFRSLQTGTTKEIILKMPKFKLEQTLDLKESLRKMGMTDLFNEQNGNLRGISNTPLVVSEVVQKAFIEVNEEGSEAAAATEMCLTLCYIPPETIHVDKPFILLILHNSIGILFMGRVMSPNF